MAKMIYSVIYISNEFDIFDNLNETLEEKNISILFIALHVHTKILILYGK